MWHLMTSCHSRCLPAFPLSVPQFPSLKKHTEEAQGSGKKYDSYKKSVNYCDVCSISIKQSKKLLILKSDLLIFRRKKYWISWDFKVYFKVYFVEKIGNFVWNSQKISLDNFCKNNLFLPFCCYFCERIYCRTWAFLWYTFCILHAC